MGSQVDSREGRFGELRFKAKGLGLGFRELHPYGVSRAFLCLQLLLVVA